MLEVEFCVPLPLLKEEDISLFVDKVLFLSTEGEVLLSLIITEFLSLFSEARVLLFSESKVLLFAESKVLLFAESKVLLFAESKVLLSLFRRGEFLLSLVPEVPLSLVNEEGVLNLSLLRKVNVDLEKYSPIFFFFIQETIHMCGIRLPSGLTSV